MNYVSSSENSSPFRLIPGRSLAKLPAHKRRRIALEMLAGGVEITRPTVTQIAALCRVPPLHLYCARNGHKPPKPSLAERLAHASAEERVAAVRAIGIDNMVGWLCEAERASAAAK
jgi:hypothetical protein